MINVFSFTCLYVSFSKVALLPKKMLLLQLQQVYSSDSKPRGHDRMSAERDTNLTAAQSGLQVSVQRYWHAVCFKEYTIMRLVTFYFDSPLSTNYKLVCNYMSTNSQSNVTLLGLVE